MNSLNMNLSSRLNHLLHKYTQQCLSGNNGLDDMQLDQVKALETPMMIPQQISSTIRSLCNIQEAISAPMYVITQQNGQPRATLSQFVEYIDR